MCRGAASGKRRYCPSCSSPAAAFRSNGNRRLTRLARRRVSEYLQCQQLPQTAEMVLKSPPSILHELMSVMKIDIAVLGEGRVPAADCANVASAEPVIACAFAELAALAQGPTNAAPAMHSEQSERPVIVPAPVDCELNKAEGLVARRRLAESLERERLTQTAAMLMDAPVGIVAAFMDALELGIERLGGAQMPTASVDADMLAQPIIACAHDERERLAAEDRRRAASARAAQPNPARTGPRHLGIAKAGQPIQRGGRVAAATKAPEQKRLACQADPDRVIQWEKTVKQIFSTGTRTSARATLAEAQMFCKDCPLATMCSDNARNADYTGVAGGQVFVGGRHRSRPTNPARVVA